MIYIIDKKMEKINKKKQFYKSFKKNIKTN